MPDPSKIAESTPKGPARKVPVDAYDGRYKEADASPQEKFAIGGPVVETPTPFKNLRSVGGGG